MICAHCNQENSAGQKRCDFCGQLLGGKNRAPLIIAIFMHTLGFIIIMAAIFFTVCRNSSGPFIASLLLLLFVVISIINIKRITNRPLASIMSLVVGISEILLLFVLIVWGIDAPPIENDYTVADFVSAPSEYDETYELLLSMADAQGVAWPEDDYYDTNDMFPNLPGVDWDKLLEDERTEDRPNTLSMAISDLIDNSDLSYARRLELSAQYADDIRDIWQSSKALRTIIHELNSYDHISDLSTPTLQDLDLDHYNSFKDVAKVHLLYAPLACEQSDTHKVAVSLCEYDAVVQKHSVYARDIISKLICYSAMRMNIHTANAFLNHPQIDPETINILTTHFIPIREDVTSIQNTFIYENLRMFLFFENFTELDIPNARWIRGTPLLKRNSTLRLFHNYYNQMIICNMKTNDDNVNKYEELTVWPTLYPDFGPVHLDAVKWEPENYILYNPLGALLLPATKMTLDQFPNFRSNVHVQNDLLQTILKVRQGMPFDLTARAYGDKYIYDAEKHMLYSPGADGEPFTDDDIKLIINPEVIDIKR